MPVGTSAKRPNPSTSDISSRIWNQHQAGYTVNDNRAPAFDRDGRALNYYTQKQQAKDLYGLNVPDVAPQPIGSQWQVSNRDYPDAYLDGIDSNTRIIITNITDDDQWPVKVAMEWKMHDGVGIDIQWNEWAFHDSYWTRTPEESVSRYMSNAKRRYQQAMFRWGHSIKMERGHFFTPEGQLEFGYKMVNSHLARESIEPSSYPCSPTVLCFVLLWADADQERLPDRKSVV